MSELLDALRNRPDGRALLEIAPRNAYLVGGTVRDLMLGAEPRELDVVVDGDPTQLLTALDRVVLHDQFATATATLAGGSVDVARARRERYRAPGALPEVEPASLAEDLLRRDFTVNAIAVSLTTGEVHAAPRALEDLEARVLRVFHDASFTDDPTRLIRLARYAERLQLTVEPHTAQLAAAASFDTLSGARLGDELRHALAEPDPVAVLGRLPLLSFDGELAQRAEALLPPDGDRGLLLLACCAALRERVTTLELTVRERAAVMRGFEAAQIARRIGATVRPSDLHAVLRPEPIEAVALAGALGEEDGARSWLEQLRHVRLAINGSDLLDAGVPEGPEVGSRLARTLARKLDGELAEGRDAELAEALR
jgi:tRNA nucleotidyltransferase (CCA-adding enzyme)